MRKAIVTFVALMLVVGAVVLLAPRGSKDPPAAPADSAPVSGVLSDQQAIERLSALDAIRFQALEQREESLLSEAFTPSGPAIRAVRKTINELISDRVEFSVARYDAVSEEVVSRTSDSVVIRQEVIVDYDFTTESGGDQSVGEVERQTLVTVLKRIGNVWLFHKGTIESAEPLDG